MNENLDKDKHYIGFFNIDGNQFQGEIVHNEKNGVILLCVRSEFNIDDFDKWTQHQDKYRIITGKLSNGIVVNLYGNTCVKNQLYNFQYRELQYKVKYMIWSNKELPNPQFDKITCEIENGLKWSGLTKIDIKELPSILLNKNEQKTFFWHNAQITFSTSINNELSSFPRKEVCEITERLLISIESNEKKDIAFFTDVRDKILSMISFAIRDNLNVIKQYFTEYDDFDYIEEFDNYQEHLLIESEPVHNIYDNHFLSYNFFLDNLPQNDHQLSKHLEKLVPVFNLYLSLFKYPDMPIEMIFLNIVQALETFHSRFFYNDDKKEYVQYVEEKYEKDSLRYKLLLSDTQMNKNCNYIILVSRLNDLLIRGKNDLFKNYYQKDYAQKIADTRHYYTHYGERKKDKALKGDALRNAIQISRLLLEYHVCSILNIDITKRVSSDLRYCNSIECE